MTIATEHPDLTITQLLEDDAREHFALIDRNREHLSLWLPWVPLAKTPRDVARFILLSQASWHGRHELACAVRLHGTIIGGIGIVDADHENDCVSLGYWLDAEHCGQGFMTMAVKAMTHWCFEDQGRRRVQIRAAVGNIASRNIPERLGFMQEGLLRQAARVGEVWHDMVLYARLCSDSDR